MVGRAGGVGVQMGMGQVPRVGPHVPVVRATKGRDQWKEGAAEGPPLCAPVSGLFAPPSPRPH